MNKSFYLDKLSKLSPPDTFSISKFICAQINYKHNFSFSEKTPSKSQDNNEIDLQKVRKKTASRVY